MKKLKKINIGKHKIKKKNDAVHSNSPQEGVSLLFLEAIIANLHWCDPFLLFASVENHKYTQNRLPSLQNRQAARESLENLANGSTWSTGKLEPATWFSLFPSLKAKK